MYKHLNFNGMIRIKRNFLAVKALVWVAVCAIMFSFSGEAGTHSFEVYLGNKLIMKEYVSTETPAKTFGLDKSFSNEEMKINYNQCGRLGLSRSLFIKDSQDKVLKEWHFPDVAAGASPYMVFKVKDILALQKTDRERVKLVYSSKDVPNQLLATIVLGENKNVSLN